MKKTFASLALVCVAVLTPSAPVSAQTLDAASSEALAAVLQMLTSPGQRGAAVAADPRAASADSQIRALAGSDKMTEEIYGLAAQVFEELTRASGGDGNKMKELLARGQADPASLEALLSPATLARLRDIATRISDQKR